MNGNYNENEYVMHGLLVPPYHFRLITVCWKQQEKKQWMNPARGWLPSNRMKTLTNEHNFFFYIKRTRRSTCCFIVRSVSSVSCMRLSLPRHTTHRVYFFIPNTRITYNILHPSNVFLALRFVCRRLGFILGWSLMTRRLKRESCLLFTCKMSTRINVNIKCLIFIFLFFSFTGRHQTKLRLV